MTKPILNTTQTMRGNQPDEVAPQTPGALSKAELLTLNKDELIALIHDEQTKSQQLQMEMDRARATADAAALMTSNVIEVYAGKKTVRDEVEAGKFEEHEHEYWKYTIDLPPSAGMAITINGMPAYHGQTVTVDTDTLRTIKDMVYRAWYHEQSIFGVANDNAFRQGYMNGGRVGAVLSPKGPGAHTPAWASSRA